MANYNVKTTGTRGSGTSTPGDWTDANCYNSSNTYNLPLLDADTVVFDEMLAGLGQTNHLTAFEALFTKGVTVDTRFNINGGGAILGRTSGGTVFSTSVDSTALMTINNLKFSGANVGTVAWHFRSSTVTQNIIVNNVEIIGGGIQSAIDLNQENGSIAFNSLTLSGAFIGSGIFSANTLGTNAPMSVTIDGLHFNDMTSSAIGGGFYSVLLRKGDFANAVTIDIKNVTGKHSAISTGVPQGIEIQSADNVIIDDVTYEINSIASGSGAYGIRVFGASAANQQVKAPIIRNCNVKFYCPAGDAISVGRDADTGLNYVTNCEVYGNVCEGINSTATTPHGIVFRGLSTGRGYRNHCKRLHSPMMLSMCVSDNVEMFGCLITDTYGNSGNRGVGLSLKGNSGGRMHNNTVILTPNSIDGLTSMNVSAIWARSQSGTDNTASKTYNNNIIVLGFAPDDFIFTNVAAASANTFSSNNYYMDGTPPANAFTYAGNNYANLAAWNAAQETNDATEIAIFNTTAAAIIAAFGDLPHVQLAASPATIGGGEKWWVNGPRPDTLLEPLPDTEIDRGIQSRSSPNHPANL